MPPVKDYYRVLRVARNASIETIEAAYRRLAREAHPDLNDAPGATQWMQELNEARAALRDPLQRAAVDAALALTARPAAPAPRPQNSTPQPAPPAARPAPRPPARPRAPQPPPIRRPPAQTTTATPRPAPKPTPSAQPDRAAERDRADAVRERMADAARHESAVLGWGSIAIFAGWAIFLVNVLPPLFREVTAGMMAMLLGMAVVLTLPFGYALDQLLGRRRASGQVLLVVMAAYFGLVAAAYFCGGVLLLFLPSLPAFPAADVGPALILAGLMAVVHFTVALGLHRRARAGQIGALALATGGAVLAVLLLGQQPTWAGAALALNAALIVMAISLEP